MENNSQFMSRAKRRPRHSAYLQNRKRIKHMLSPTYGPAFMQDNPPFSTVTTATGKVIFRNPVDYDALDRRKWEMSLTNNDILALFRSLSNGSDGITAATLSRKLQGEMDFTASEILLMAQIFDLSPDEIVSIFHLCPKRHNQTEDEYDQAAIDN